MRESKSFEERLQELRDKYEPINDFDLISILKLEDEYNFVLIENAEHTKRRRDILDMRYRLLSNLRHRG